VLITHEFVTVIFLPVYDRKHLKLANSVARIVEYIVFNFAIAELLVTDVFADYICEFSSYHQ